MINNKGFIKYGKNSFLQIIDKFLRLIFGILIGVWVARYMGPERFGLYNFVISFVGIFSTFTALGIESIVIKELIDNNSNKNNILGTSLALRLSASFLVIMFILIYTNLTMDDMSTNLLIGLYSVSIFFQAFNVIDLFFQSKLLGKNILIVNFIGMILSGIIKVFLIINKLPLFYFILNLLFDSFFLAIGYIVMYNMQNTSIVNWQYNKDVSIQFLKLGWPLLLSNVIVSLYMRIDQILIKYFLGNEAIGQFSAAIRITESWYFIPMTICASLFPAIINARKIGNELYMERLTKLFKLLSFISIFIAIIFTIFSEKIILLLYGKDFIDAAGVLSITSWAGIFVCFGVASSSWLVLENLQILSFWRTFLGLIMNLFLNILLIPKYGIIGSAYATLISQVFAAYIFDITNPKLHKIFLIKTKSFIPF